MKSYRRHAKTLALFFECTPLNKITINHVRDYQEARVQGGAPFIRRRRPHEAPAPCPCKPQQVNQELGFLRCVMQRAGCKMDSLQFYEELREPETDIPRALSPEEHRLWLDVSRQKERWFLIHWYSVLAFETTMSTNELRGLRIGDIDLHHRIVSVPWAASKNKHRHRSNRRGRRQKHARPDGKPSLRLARPPPRFSIRDAGLRRQGFSKLVFLRGTRWPVSARW